LGDEADATTTIEPNAKHQAHTSSNQRFIPTSSP
jgi:hypothetical protein